MLKVPAKRHRVIINTDAKNEADDQYAIVHAVLTPSFELHGFIAAHFGTLKSATSMQDSRKEIDLCLDLMDLGGKIRVENGATHAIVDDRTAQPSAGAELIIAEAMKEDPRPLHIAFLGPLTDMASALLMEPRIASRSIRVVWIGGGRWPVGGPEYNLSNDIDAANVVMRSGLEIWMIPQPVYRHMPVSYAELMVKVYEKGRIGKYLVDQLVEWNERMVQVPIEHRSLGDSPAVGLIMYPECGFWSHHPAPGFSRDMNYIHPGTNKPVKLYESIDCRFIHEDFFAKLDLYARGKLSIPF